MAFLIPTGLHAKQLVDFCMMEMAANEMAADHSCCESDAEKDMAENQTHGTTSVTGALCAPAILETVLLMMKSGSLPLKVTTGFLPKKRRCHLFYQPMS